MMKIRNLWVTVVTLFVLVIGTATCVSADQATDLSSLKVYAVDAAGNKTEVKMNFIQLLIRIILQCCLLLKKFR